VHRVLDGDASAVSFCFHLYLKVKHRLKIAGRNICRGSSSLSNVQYPPVVHVGSKTKNRDFLQENPGPDAEHRQRLTSTSGNLSC
jgi:hypothetical protein